MENPAVQNRDNQDLPQALLHILLTYLLKLMRADQEASICQS